MSHKILTSKGTIATRRTLRKILKSELVFNYDKSKRNLFGDFIEKKIGSSMFYPESPIPENISLYEDAY